MSGMGRVHEGTRSDPWFGFDADPSSPQQPNFSNLFIMGMPRTHSLKYVDMANQLLAPLGLSASAGEPC